MAEAVVLLSGGLDSSTCAFEAKSAGFSGIKALSFNYGQRHSIELQQAAAIAAAVGASEHIILHTDFGQIGASALTDDSIAIPLGGGNLGKPDFIPVTYVPARNLIFLSYASALAEARGITDIFIGINALDYSGYPDCRDDFLQSFSHTARLATRSGREGRPFRIHAPLLHLTKADIVRRAVALGVPLEKTWSCYNPQQTPAGFKPCRQCDSCLLREKGFAEAGVVDPTL